jgi:flagellar hook-associated protein FlgK
MAMESVLQQLEERIEKLVATYQSEVARATELESEVAELSSKIQELETKLANESDAEQRVKALEDQRDQLAGRLEKVLKLIDGVLDTKD